MKYFVSVLVRIVNIFFHLEPMFLDIGFEVWVPAELFLFKILKTGELSSAHLSPGPGRLPSISLIF